MAGYLKDGYRYTLEMEIVKARKCRTHKGSIHREVVNQACKFI